MEQALVWTTELRVRVGPKVMQEGRIQGQGGTQGHAGAQNPGLDAVRTANYWRGGGVCVPRLEVPASSSSSWIRKKVLSCQHVLPIRWKFESNLLSLPEGCVA